MCKIILLTILSCWHLWEISLKKKLVRIIWLWNHNWSSVKIDWLIDPERFILCLFPSLSLSGLTSKVLFSMRLNSFTLRKFCNIHHIISTSMIFGLIFGRFSIAITWQAAGHGMNWYPSVEVILIQWRQLFSERIF